ADQPLECGDLMADRGLDVAEARCRPAERSFAGDGVERHEVPHLDPRPPFRRHAGCDDTHVPESVQIPMHNSRLTRVPERLMTETIQIEVPRRGVGSDLTEALAAHGLDAEI